ncbi:MAG: hypothetical protein Ct9H300mP1_19400 [Planctomycetaceae bacterium]|nr:MAG: hypothetical protein Ct9H300mP1_19400 [Planctomycetaceae bacterium]
MTTSSAMTTNWETWSLRAHDDVFDDEESEDYAAPVEQRIVARSSTSGGSERFWP